VGNGTSNLNIASANANVTVAVSGVANVATFTPAGITALALSITGSSGILSGTGAIVTTGSITGGNVLTSGRISAVGNIQGSIILGNVANSTTTTPVNAVGFQGIPVVTVSGSYSTTGVENGKQLYWTGGAGNITIAQNTLSVGAAFSIAVGSGAGNVSIAPGTGQTLHLIGNGQSGTRRLAAFGFATVTQVTGNTWYIGGTGIT
jgi:hypothetical protein